VYKSKISFANHKKGWLWQKKELLDSNTIDQIMQYSKKAALQNVEHNKINWQAQTYTNKKGSWSNKIDSNFS